MEYYQNNDLAVCGSITLQVKASSDYWCVFFDDDNNKDPIERFWRMIWMALRPQSRRARGPVVK